MARAKAQADLLADLTFDPVSAFRAALQPIAPWDSIVDFATHPSYCGLKLYPRQITLLRLIYLETDQMTAYDLDVIESWRDGFLNNPRNPEGVQPDIWERVEYLKERGYRHFPHIEAIVGRRGSKGKIGGVLGAEKLAFMYSLDDWQSHYGVSPGKDGYLSIVATNSIQAKKFQFADIRETVENCTYLQKAIASSKEYELTIRTPADLRRIAYLHKNKIPIDHQVASLHAIAMSSNSASGRGATGFCLDPETPVLTADLRWVPIKSVLPGDEVVGVDENPEPGLHRKVRKAVVQAKTTTRRPAWRLTFDDDSSVVCSGDHRWLIRVKSGGRNYQWRATRGRSAHHSIKPGTQIVQLVKPWEEDNSREAGYLAGVFDGEGSLSQGASNGTGMAIFFSQNPGAVLDETTRLLKEKGFNIQPQNSNAYLDPMDKMCQQWAIRGMSESLRFLGQIRPLRLLEKAPRVFDGVSVRGKGATRHQDGPKTYVKTVVSVEELPEQDLVDIQTSTGTFVANGLVSHNCNMFDEFAHMITGTGSQRSSEEIYEAYQPSLDQFGKDSMTYIPSSPFSMVGHFYALYQEGKVLMSTYDDDTGRERVEMKTAKELGTDSDSAAQHLIEITANPEMLIVQLPSWGLYEDWRNSPALGGPVFRRPIQAYDERMMRLERSNPEKFRVERRSQFAAVMDAFFDPRKVEAMFDPPDWRETLVPQARGRLDREYYVHVDPGLTNANFALAVAHIEDAPPDEEGDVWPHVIVDYMRVWKPQDYPDHTIDYVQVQREVAEVLRRFPTTRIFSADQWNCQIGSTLVPTEYGMLRLDELVGDVPVGEAVSLDAVVQSRFAPAVVRQGFHRGVVATRRITTKLGNVVEVTPEHRLWVRKNKAKHWHADKPWGFEHARDIGVGDLLCLRRNTILATEQYDLTTLPQWRAEWVSTVDENVGEALGLLLAEGDYKDDKCRFGNSDDEVLERYRTLMDKSFGTKGKFGGEWISKIVDDWKGKYHYGWVRKQGHVPRLLASLGLTGSSTGKVVPWVIRRSPREVVTAFLRGYFEGDGGVCFGREGEVWLEATTTSREVGEVLQQLLLAVGVFSTLWSGAYRYKGESRDQWRIKMYGPDLLDFAEKIGFSCSRKQGELDVAVRTVLMGDRIGHRSKNHRHDDEYWVRVVDIEESSADCYDLSVPGPETYIANGIVSHNSAGMLAALREEFSPRITVIQETFTEVYNQQRMERMKSAVNLGWVHAYRDNFFGDGDCLLELEMKFLQRQGKKIDKQEFGPVTTKDLFDSVNVVTDRLLKDDLDRWQAKMLRLTSPAIGSSDVAGIRSGRELERLRALRQPGGAGRSARQKLAEQNRERLLGRNGAFQRSRLRGRGR